MNILVVEDNQDIAENIADYFEPLGHTLDFAINGKCGLDMAISGRFDIIILDVMLPGMNGMEVCRRLREEHQITTPVLMLTARDQLDDKIEGFHCGADDYMVKPYSVKELEVRIQALYRRSQPVSRLLRVADLQFDLDTWQVSRQGVMLDLNPIQRTALELLMKKSPGIVTREELENHIWHEHIPDKDLLRSHIYSLRNTIDKPFDVKLLHTVYGTGYRLCEESA